MTKYEVWVRMSGSNVYYIEANSEDEAKEIVLDGDLEPDYVVSAFDGDVDVFKARS